MPTLATGTSVNDIASPSRRIRPRVSRGLNVRATGGARPARARGFSLVEIMIVVFIVGLFSALAIISYGGQSRDTQLEEETERLDALFAYAREQAELQTRDYGLRINRQEYSFVVFDILANQWRPVDEDDALRARQIPEGVIPELVIEGRGVVLETRKPKVEDYTPQIMIFANGDITSFELALEREGTDLRGRLWSDEDTNIRRLLPGQTETAAPARAAKLP